MGAESGCGSDLLSPSGDHDESSGFRCNDILKQRIPCDKQVEGEFYFLVDHQFY